MKPTTEAKKAMISGYTFGDLLPSLDNAVDGNDLFLGEVTRRFSDVPDYDWELGTVAALDWIN